jgi:hypothetical protein
MCDLVLPLDRRDQRRFHRMWMKDAIEDIVNLSFMVVRGLNLFGGGV